MTVRSRRILSGVTDSSNAFQLTVPEDRTVIIKHLAATNTLGSGTRIKGDIYYSGESPLRRWLDQSIAQNGNLQLNLWVVVMEEETIEITSPGGSGAVPFVLSGTVLHGVAPW